MRSIEPRPILPFRVHFEYDTFEPIDINACDPDEVRKRVAVTHPKMPVNKVKLVREKI